MNKRKALGIGTSAAGGAASGSVFGPVGAAIGGGIGGLLGLAGALDDSEEEALKRQREQAKRRLLIELQRNQAAQYGAPTQALDAQIALRDINARYDEGIAGIDDVNPQDILGLAQSAAAIGKNASDWGEGPDEVSRLPAPPKRSAEDLERSDRGILMTKGRRRPGAH